MIGRTLQNARPIKDQRIQIIRIKTRAAQESFGL